MSMTAAKSGWEWILWAESWRYLCAEDKSFNQAVHAHTLTAGFWCEYQELDALKPSSIAFEINMHCRASASYAGYNSTTSSKAFYFPTHTLVKSKFSGHKENVSWDLSDKYPFWGPLSSYKGCLQNICFL